MREYAEVAAYSALGDGVRGNALAAASGRRYGAQAPQPQLLQRQQSHWPQLQGLQVQQAQAEASVLEEAPAPLRPAGSSSGRRSLSEDWAGSVSKAAVFMMDSGCRATVCRCRKHQPSHGVKVNDCRLRRDSGG